jgi:hypothetical protein
MNLSSWITAGMFSALCLAGGTRSAAAELREEPGLLEVMTLWIEANFGLPAVAQMPALVSLPAEELSARRYGPGAVVPTHGVVALYDEAQSTIYVSDEWTGHTVADHSIILHELVHHMQAASGSRFACAGERETLAYRAQDAWLSLFGESLESAFGIDRLTILVTTTCTN